MKARKKEQNLRKKGYLSTGTALISAINIMEYQETKRVAHCLFYMI